MKETRGAAETPPLTHEVTRSAVENEESVLIRKGIEHRCWKNGWARTEGRYLERPVTCTVQHTKHDCCSRSGRANGGALLGATRHVHSAAHNKRLLQQVRTRCQTQAVRVQVDVAIWDAAVAFLQQRSVHRHPHVVWNTSNYIDRKAKESLIGLRHNRVFSSQPIQMLLVRCHDLVKS